MARPKKKITNDENQKPLFFDSVNVTEFPAAKSLPKIKILKNKRYSEYIFLEFMISVSTGLINIYLYVNGRKKDMIYQVEPGKYSFRFGFQESENLIELYYSRGRVRSEKTVFTL